MSILKRRYIFRITFCIPVVWFLIALIILKSNYLSKGTSDNQAYQDGIVNEPIVYKNNSINAFNFVRQLRKIGSKFRQIHRERKLVAPHVDEEISGANAPGEMGTAVEIDPNQLKSDQLRKYKEGFKKHSFNEYVSDLIAIDRNLPDVRDPGCQQIEYKIPNITASIVMCFHNEAWSTLLRSLHSITNRTPLHLLKEIILVDDFSDMAQLKKPLDDYIKKLKIVSIIRLKKREGLIRSRLAGAEAVKSDVLIYLDSHIEVTQGWLEPLLDPISRNRTIIVTPIIDSIDDTSFKYVASKLDPVGVGGFDWNLHFSWHSLPERDQKKRKHRLELARSPTMAGGLFAISTSYFYELGTYDAGMEIWGGENLELSFRIWMCGGTLLTAPCSRVGHIFRATSPYKFVPGTNVVQKNAIRLAEVWLDEYKEYFYERFNFKPETYGDVSARKLLRKKLQCKSFKWYLTEVYPELYVPDDAIALGDIESLGQSTCLDVNAEHKSFKKPLGTFPCHDQGGNQFFLLNPAGEIRRDDGCLEYGGGKLDMDKDDKVLIDRCHGQRGNQSWIYNKNNQIYHPTSDSCLALTANKHIQMQRCDVNNGYHKWLWDRKTGNVQNKTDEKIENLF
ncbi:unnamed protein product [Adineta steineri]|uniref:Polypeptide N-acetylgalactosaminyltransferase n=2 Tax=Adineta steineri TaxID=433720 RepID=A0A819FD50_9BILA|nr:unnamed protein product [Adineta steineri]